MSYTVGNGAILEVSFLGRSYEQRTISLFHYRYETGSGPVDGPTLINTVNPLINSAAANKLLSDYMAPLAEGFTMEQIVYQWIFPTRYARVVKSPMVTAGSVVDSQVPPNTALAITKKGDAAGRRNVGTLHMPGVPLGGLNGGEWAVATLDSFGNLLTRLHEAVNIEFGINLIPVLLHRAAPADSPEITNANSNITVRTMHRRTVGLGE